MNLTRCTELIVNEKNLRNYKIIYFRFIQCSSSNDLDTNLWKKYQPSEFEKGFLVLGRYYGQQNCFLKYINLTDCG